MSAVGASLGPTQVLRRFRKDRRQRVRLRLSRHPSTLPSINRGERAIRENNYRSFRSSSEVVMDLPKKNDVIT